MLTGKAPFSGANFAQIWDQHLHSPPPSLKKQNVDCPDWLEGLVSKLLEKDPENRPFNARAVQGLVRDHLEDDFGPDAAQLTRDLPPLEDVPGGVKPIRIVIALVVLSGLIGLLMLASR
jgi:serine/threonine protein kinase